MYKAKVIANKLNIRNTPTADPEYKNWAGELLKGDEFTATDIIEGQVYNNSPYWYKDEYNRFASLTGIGDDDPRIGWSLRTLGVPHIWTKTKGEGIKVAIIDSGIDLNNSDLRDAVPMANRYNVLDGTSNVQDNYSHGSFCASIVGSRGVNGIFGVAPGCELIVIKIANVFNDYLNENNQIKGVQKAIELGANIISMSFGNVLPNAKMQALLINIAIESGIICIAASGDDSIESNVEYPADNKKMISVGSVSCNNILAKFGEGIFTQSDNSTGGIPDNLNEGITIVAPGDGVSGYDKYGNKKIIDGTSFSAPYVAGIAALWLKININKNFSSINYHKAFKDFIITNANKNINDYTLKFSGNGLITPSSILSI